MIKLSYDYNGVLEKNTVVKTVIVNTPNLIFSPIWFSLKQSKKRDQVTRYSIEYSFVWPIHVFVYE